MKSNFILKMKEALMSVLPVTVLVLIISFTILPMPFGTMAQFIIGAILLILGMAFFTLGVDISMMAIGEKVGSHLAKSKKIWLIAIVGFLIGVFITIAEPDLQVLASQTPGVPNLMIILSVAIGVGFFLVIALLRILFKIKFSTLLILIYLGIFVLAMFVPSDFVPLAFDSGGVTTGPMTVPFIMALGVGMASIRTDKDSGNDSFGLVALCSAGPIIAVMMLGILFRPDSSGSPAPLLLETNRISIVIKSFIASSPIYLKEVLLALLPILLFFIIFQIFALKLSKKQVVKIVIGFIYTYIGLALFLLGANAGFMPTGYFIGSEIMSSNYSFLVIPLGMIIGFLIVAAEPAVHVLKHQVEDLSEGNISASSIQISLSLGVAVSVGLALFRATSGISIWYLLIPGYALAILFTFFTPPLFIAIAFDSGGVASGPMTATFLLSLSIGVAETAGGNILTDAFGTVAMVAMTPLIAIQALGLLYKYRTRHTLETEDNYKLSDEILDNDEIIYYDDDSENEDIENIDVPGTGTGNLDKNHINNNYNNKENYIKKDNLDE